MKNIILIVSFMTISIITNAQYLEDNYKSVVNTKGVKVKIKKDGRKQVYRIDDGWKTIFYYYFNSKGEVNKMHIVCKSKSALEKAKDYYLDAYQYAKDCNCYEYRGMKGTITQKESSLWIITLEMY